MFNKFSNSFHFASGTWALVVVFFLSMSAHAQGVGVEPEVIATTKRWLDDALVSVRQSGANPLRMEVAVGELDSRLRLAPCARIEPYIPVGARLWVKPGWACVVWRASPSGMFFCR
jgi:hypothetical protein